MRFLVLLGNIGGNIKLNQDLSGYFQEFIIMSTKLKSGLKTAFLAVIILQLLMLGSSCCFMQNVLDATRCKDIRAFEGSTYNIVQYGAKGDGRTNDAPAIQKAIDACFAGGGGRVLLPGGKTYYSGSVILKPNIELYLESGAVLKASVNIADFRTNEAQEGFGSSCGFISAVNAANITICGSGIIDGSGFDFMRSETEDIYKAKRDRPYMLYTVGCNHLTIKGVTFQNAPFWTIRLIGSDDVLIDGIRILNSLKVPNCDGIDLDHTRNARIANCHIVAGDDAIVLKNEDSFRKYGPCENITVSGCTLVSTSSAFKLGTGSFGDFRNIVVNNCVIYGSHRGISIQVRDTGDVENVLFSNIIVETQHFAHIWWGRGEPIYITSMRRTGDTEAGRVRNIRFNNVVCRGENGVLVYGTEDKPIEDIVFDNVRIEIDKWTKWEMAGYDLRPGLIRDVYGESNAGIYCKYVKNMTLRDTEVVWGDNVPEYFGPALEAYNVEGLDFERFKGTAAHPDKGPDKIIDWR